MKKIFLILSFGFLSVTSSVDAQKGTAKPVNTTDLKADQLWAFNFRNIGPALTSGRISDIAVHPTNSNLWYVTAAAGGVWKTTNHGTTFSPIFDNYGSFSIACVELAPSNANTIWIGTGENNNQRSASYGDGVYKSIDAGKSFTKMGLDKSEHIGNIIIHPSNENILWVAAYGPLWSEGGERGVYKSVDGGKTWTNTLQISKNTGISEISIDPKNSDILYAAAHQRRRHEYTYIGGGPESALYKSTDGGVTWKTINSGLPEGQMGRIGIANTLADENYVYAIVEAKNGAGGVFRSTNKGESWSKMSGFSTSGNYYQEIICDPLDKNKLFFMDTWLHHSTDGGKTVVATGEDTKHVDNHCIWVNPSNTDHWIVGCDGGIYETFNHAQDWKYFDNLPIIQFYKVATDNALPFYYVYGGTQDNNSMGGPSATINNAGILNSDWFITNGGDGFESAIDWSNPNIVYAQSQYGGLVRYDKLSGEKVTIQPLPGKGEKPYRWNWDAPLLVSPHDASTLYFAANQVFKSTNKGDDWTVISGDLTQQIDRNKLKVMDQVWSVDAVMKNASTTIYGNIVALDESPKEKGLLIAGTDDGLIQISKDGGTNWSKQSAFTGIPANTRVNQLMWSPTDANVVYAIFNNHRAGDFKPYVFKSSNKGTSWVNISSNLPVRGSAYCIKQDHIDAKLLFVGTEFGLFVSNNAGATWVQMKGGLPTTAIYDIDIQQRENDLVLASFGRGFYVLDDYSALRQFTNENLTKPAYLFPIKDALLYVPTAPLGLSGTGSQGGDLYVAENPKFGATFTVNIKDGFTSLKSKRMDAEKALEKDKKDVVYPEISALRAEGKETANELLFIIRDKEGKEIKRMLKSPSKGSNRYVWNLRAETTSPIKLAKSNPGRYDSPDEGFLVSAGVYSVEIYLLEGKGATLLVDKTNFNVKRLNNQALPATDLEGIQKTRNETAELVRLVDASASLHQELANENALLIQAIKTYPAADIKLLTETTKVKMLLDSASIMLHGDGLLASKEFETYPSIYNRLGTVQYQLFESTSNATASQMKNLNIVKEEFASCQAVIEQARTIIKALEVKLSASNVPYIRKTNAPKN